ncbi:transcription repressor OFP16-like [Primulina huaijiensis]|uniref:transcription repressor OFP16-like n=1 Tax=Primulina huaijiensis TaxID=1492673 RepID=UPI003CC78BA0
MSNMLWKSFNLCFSKFKCLPLITFTPPLPIQEENEQDDNDSTPPPAINDPSAVTITTFDSEISTTTTASSFDDYDIHDDSIPDFSSAYASHRFFFSTPGSSNSIFEQPQRLMDSGEVVSGSVAIQKYTSDPYADFKESMQEMIEAHDWTDLKSSGEFLHDLLMCYLTLNHKHTHKFIIDAFADIVVSLVSPPVSCRSTPHRRRRHRATPSPPV